jgi:hypothetical protein
MRGRRFLLGSLATAAMLTLARPCLAQAADSSGSGDVAAILIYVVFAAGAVVTAYLGADAFRRRQFQLADVPTLPRYMTRPQLFHFGMGVFVAACLLIYAVLVCFYKDFLPIVQFFDPDAYRWLVTVAEPSSYTTGIIVGTAIFFLLLGYEHRANILLILRDLIYSWVSIPEKCSELMTLIRDNLEIPKDAAEAVLTSRFASNLSLRDFTKDKETPDRKLAEISYMIWWLRQKEKTGENLSFFSEPSLLWEQVKTAYARVTDKVARDRKSGILITDSQSDDTFADINALYAKLLRLVACFLVYDNGDERGLWESANRFGVTHDVRVIRNPASSCFAYACAVMLTTYLSVTLAALGFDWIMTGSLKAAFAKMDAAIAWRWVAYAVAIYCVPLLVILLSRFISQELNPRNTATSSSVPHYAAVFLVSMALATMTLAVMLKLLSYGAAQYGVFELMSRSIRWSLGPAIAGVYVIYCMDTVLDSTVLSAKDIGARLLAGLTLGTLMALLATIPATTITLPPGHPWSLGKAEFVSVASTFAIGLVMGALATFGRLDILAAGRAQAHALAQGLTGVAPPLRSAALASMGPLEPAYAADKPTADPPIQGAQALEPYPSEP